MKVVSNSSPIIILYKCDKLELLKNLFGQVLTPEAVHHEVVHNTKDAQQSEAISRCDFIQVHRFQINNWNSATEKTEARQKLSYWLPPQKQTISCSMISELRKKLNYIMLISYRPLQFFLKQHKKISFPILKQS